jgi:hypothetical protein
MLHEEPLKRTDAREMTIEGPGMQRWIKERGASRQLRLRKGMTSGRIFRKFTELEIEKRIVGSSNGLQEVTGHCGRVGLLRNERDIQSAALRKEG